MTKIRGDKIKKQKKRSKKRKPTYEKKSNVWYCFNCDKKIGMWDEKCKYCGTNQFGKNNEYYPDEKSMKKVKELLQKQQAEELLQKKFQREKKQTPPIFSEEECFLYGIHPDDEMYRKVMELNILTKNYDE